MNAALCLNVVHFQLETSITGLFLEGASERKNRREREREREREGREGTHRPLEAAEPRLIPQTSRSNV